MSPPTPEKTTHSPNTSGALRATGILVIEALVTINKELGTTTAIITHNAAIKDVAHRVIYFIDGRIARIEDNERRIEPSMLSW